MKSPATLSFFLGLLHSFLFLANPLPISGSGLPYKGLTITGLNITGRVVCSTSHNPPSNSPGIGGVNVVITCNDGSTNLGSVITDPNGFFDILATAIGALTTDNNALPCVATATLPPNLSCSVFPPKATLRATLSLVGTVVKVVLGLVAEVTTAVFTLL